MTKKLNHEISSKIAAVRKHGGELISHNDRTLSRSGYPSARDMAASLPERRSLELDITPLTYKQESLDVAVREARRLEAEKVAAKVMLKEKRRTAGEARRKAAQPPPKVSLPPVFLTTTRAPAPPTVEQALPGSRSTRTVTVEIRSSASTTKLRRGASRD